MPIRDIPIWFDRFPKTRRPSYPRFRGEFETDVVIVGGGDGSLSSNVDHFVGQDTVFAILPLGTANSFAKTLGIGDDLDKAFDTHARAFREEPRNELTQQQLAGDRGETSFRVAVGRGRIAVYAAEVALAVDQRIAHRKILRHSDQRLVSGGVAVRVIFA